MGDRSGRLASAVLVVAALPFAGVLVIALREVHGGLTADEVIMFYAVPVLWLIGTCAALALPTVARQNVALAVISVGGALLMVEAVLALWEARAATESARRAPPTTYEESLALRSEGTHAYPRVPGNVLVDLSPSFSVGSMTVHPVTPAPGLVPVVLCTEGGGAVVYRGDRFGFDNDDASWAAGAVDLVLIGDSYTHGVCVERTAQIASHLRGNRRLLNLGATGAGPLQELAILREYAALLRPAVVAWIYYEGNDLYDLSGETPVGWLRAYLEPGYSQGLADQAESINAQYRVWLDSLMLAVGDGRAEQGNRYVDALTAVPRFRHLRAAARLGVSFPSRASPLGLMPSILMRAKADVEAWGGRLVLVYLPGYARYDVLLGEAHAGKRELLAAARDLGLQVVDLDPVFRASVEPRALWTSASGHLSPAGYELVAGALADALWPIS
jgi:hypothetical protein